MNRLEHPPRHEDAAGEADDHDRDGHQRDDGSGNGRAVPRGSPCSCRPAAACRRAAAPRRPRAARRAILTAPAPRARCRPARLLTSKSLHSGGIADEQRFRSGADDAHEEPLVAARSLLEIHRARERRQPALGVARRVFAQRRLDDLPIALGERRGQQRVGQQDDGERAGHEHRRVPEGEPQAESAGRRDGGDGISQLGV